MSGTKCQQCEGLSDDKVSLLGRRIRHLRKVHGYSTQRLSDLTGGTVTRYVLSDLETGRRQDVPLLSGIALARGFGLSVEQLVDVTIPPEAFAAANEIAIARERLGAILNAMEGS